MKNELPQRKLTRLKGYDYSLNSYYFVTICIQDRTELFSKIINEKFELTKFGRIVDEVWKKLDKFYPCEMDEYIIMPDHFHGIIILDNKGGESNKSLSTIIQRFKTFTAKKINEMLAEKNKFHWQKSFYDRIIRNETELYLIRKYIQLNPTRWELEKDLPKNLDL